MDPSISPVMIAKVEEQLSLSRRVLTQYERTTAASANAIVELANANLELAGVLKVALGLNDALEASRDISVVAAVTERIRRYPHLRDWFVDIGADLSSAKKESKMWLPVHELNWNSNFANKLAFQVRLLFTDPLSPCTPRLWVERTEEIDQEGAKLEMRFLSLTELGEKVLRGLSAPPAQQTAAPDGRP